MHIKRLLFNSIFALTLSFQWVSVSESKDLGTSEAVTKLEQLSRQLANGEIGSLEILWMDPRAVMTIPLSPASLDMAYDLKLKIESLSTRKKLTRDLIIALKNTSIEQYDKRWEEDVRWRLKFFAKNDSHTVVTLYFSGGSYKDTSLGVVDNTVVYFKGGLYKWLTLNYLSSFTQFSK
ncbi:hypothetical protein [Undibacterium sp. YM2]|uniref:hypothetical protein n=1 Tax=Undibacterium sp. YM2 TaxID=2058625 RepID=UPI00138956C0|nr:hypothetical protein [Undibacterium sp. YM2]